LCSGQARAWTADISDRGAVERGVAGFEAAFGPPDLLANIAGWDLVKNFLDTDPALWDRIIRINLYGPLHMHHVVVRGMAERGFGRVVNVASDAGRVGSSGEAVYAASKGGIIAFAKTLARELALTRIGRPDDYPRIIAFLLPDDAAYITGQTISVSGGLTMV